MRQPVLPALLVVALACSVASAREASGLTLESVNTAAFTPLSDVGSTRPSPEIIRAEVLLDRARVSPGAIDGIDGENFHKALAAYQAQVGLPASGRLDQATWTRLTADAGPVLVRRSLTAADVKGPFTRHIPAGFEKQSRLKRLGYGSVQEELSEQVHASVALLRSLNPGVRWRHAGADLLVPQVVGDRPPAKVARVVVDKAGHSVEAYAADGRRLAFYPASIGSAEKPAPTGQFVIRRVIHNPDYTYNPKYAFKGVHSDKPFTIAPGPNGPVGSVWMDLSYEGYGIHGTPQPDLVGKTQSHGCIRLTNWDAEDLASMVQNGTPVTFQDGGGADPAVATTAPANTTAPAAILAPATVPAPATPKP